MFKYFFKKITFIKELVRWITILTVNYKTSDFIDLMLYAFENLTKNPYKVIICDNYTSNEEVKKIENLTNKYKNVEAIYRKQTQVGSIGHAEAMDILVSKVDTPYFVTMDADCTFLMKNWDEVLINKLNNKIKVIGTTLPKTLKSNKPMDFPLVFAVLYESKTFKELNPSFMPDDIIKDTGWEIRNKYISSGFKGIVFDAVNTKFDIGTKYENIYCAVYYLDSQLIASHFGRGSSDGIGKYNNKLIFKIPILSRIIKNYIGKKERKDWIDKSYRIIENWSK